MPDASDITRVSGQLQIEGPRYPLVLDALGEKLVLKGETLSAFRQKGARQLSAVVEALPIAPIPVELYVGDTLFGELDRTRTTFTGRLLGVPNLRLRRGLFPLLLRRRRKSS